MDNDLLGAVRDAHTEIGETVQEPGGAEGSEGTDPGTPGEGAGAAAPESAGEERTSEESVQGGPAAPAAAAGEGAGDPASPAAAGDPAAELASLKAALAERDQQLQALTEIQQFQRALDADPQLARVVTSAVADYARGQGGAGSGPGASQSPSGAPEVRLLEPPERGWTEEEAALAEYANNLAQQNQAVLARLAQVEQITGTQLQTQFTTRVEELSSQTAARFKEVTGEDPAAFEASLKRTLAAAGQRGADLKDVAERELRYHAFGKVKPAAEPGHETKRLEQKMQGAIRTSGAPAAAPVAPGAPAERPSIRQEARKTIVDSVKGFLTRASA